MSGGAKFKKDNHIVARVGSGIHSLTNLEVTPTEQVQEFNHQGFYGYNKVTVNEIPSQYVVPEVDGEVLLLSRVSVREEELDL